MNVTLLHTAPCLFWGWGFAAIFALGIVGVVLDHGEVMALAPLGVKPSACIAVSSWHKQVGDLERRPARFPSEAQRPYFRDVQEALGLQVLERPCRRIHANADLFGGLPDTQPKLSIVVGFWPVPFKANGNVNGLSRKRKRAPSWRFDQRSFDFDEVLRGFIAPGPVGFARHDHTPRAALAVSITPKISDLGQRESPPSLTGLGTRPFAT